jgi:hypothetical protein
MTITISGIKGYVEIDLDDDSSIEELTNGFRALALTQGYPINKINEAMPEI